MSYLSQIQTELPLKLIGRLGHRTSRNPKIQKVEIEKVEIKKIQKVKIEKLKNSKLKNQKIKRAENKRNKKFSSYTKWTLQVGMMLKRSINISL